MSGSPSRTDDKSRRRRGRWSNGRSSCAPSTVRPFRRSPRSRAAARCAELPRACRLFRGNGRRWPGTSSRSDDSRRYNDRARGWRFVRLRAAWKSIQCERSSCPPRTACHVGGDPRWDATSHPRERRGRAVAEEPLCGRCRADPSPRHRPADSRQVSRPAEPEPVRSLATVVADGS